MQFRATFKAQHAFAIDEDVIKKHQLPYGEGNIMLLGFYKTHDWDPTRLVVPYNLITGNQPINKLGIDLDYDLILQTPPGGLADRLKTTMRGIDTTLLRCIYPEGVMTSHGLSPRFVDATYFDDENEKEPFLKYRFLTDLNSLYIAPEDADAFRKDASLYEKNRPASEVHHDPKLYRIVSMIARPQGR